MNFQFVVFQGSKPIAGFADFITACNYKEMMTHIIRMAGYKDRFQIKDTSKEK